MHTITFGDITVQVPGTWNELNKRQLLSMARLLSDKSSVEELKVKMLLSFTGIKVMQQPSDFFNNTEYFWLFDTEKKRKFPVSAFDLAHVSTPFVNFFKFDDKQEAYLVHPTLTKNLLPAIECCGWLFYGPADGLSNLTFDEFINAETYYEAFFDGEPDALNKLIAVLYRQFNGYLPGNVNYRGDSRIAFNDFNIDTDAKTIAHMPDHVKRAILWYYEGCKLHLGELFPYIFRKPSTSGKKQVSTFRAFMTVVDDLSSHNPSEHDRIRKTMLYDVLDSLNRRAELQEKSPETSKI